MGITYGATIRWSGRNGSSNKVSISEADTPREAWEECFAVATRAGWTRPRWFEFWRWGDRTYDDMKRRWDID